MATCPRAAAVALVAIVHELVDPASATRRLRALWRGSVDLETSEPDLVRRAMTRAWMRDGALVLVALAASTSAAVTAVTIAR